MAKLFLWRMSVILICVFAHPRMSVGDVYVVSPMQKMGLAVTVQEVAPPSEAAHLENRSDLKLLLTDQQSDLSCQENQMLDEKSQLAEQHCQLAEQENQLTELSTQVAEQENQLAEQESQLAEQHSQVKEQESQLAEQESQLAEQKSQLAEQESQLGEQKSQQGEQESQLAEQKSQLAEQESQLGEQKRQLGEQESQLGEQKSQLGEQESQLGELKSQLGEQGSQLAEQKRQLTKQQNELKKLMSKLNENAKRLSHIGGATYIRWGRTSCPTGAELVYKGAVGGGFYNWDGGASDYLCLPNDPQYYKPVLGNNVQRNYLYGAEYESYNELPGFHNHNMEVPCAVCRLPRRSTVLMVPARTSCHSGYHREYFGYLMTNYWKFKTSTPYVCVDIAPESIGSKANNDGALLYFVESQCGSLKCPPYGQGKEVTCVVCSK